MRPRKGQRRLCTKEMHWYTVGESHRRGCLQCHNNIAKAYNKANSDKVSEYRKNWFSARPDYTKQWAKQNPGSKAATSARWSRNNPAKINAQAAKNRAAKKLRTLKWLTPLHYQQIEIFYDAATKLTKEFGILMHVDHIVPLQGKIVSGLHVPWNLQVITQSENCSKNNRL